MYTTQRKITRILEVVKYTQHGRESNITIGGYYAQKILFGLWATFGGNMTCLDRKKYGDLVFFDWSWKVGHLGKFRWVGHEKKRDKGLLCFSGGSTSKQKRRWHINISFN